MNALTPSREEQAEVAAVLQSGIFRRAPLLEHFFRYVCERYFEGQSGSIKEYNIAVEALGRGAEFDPKRDSIVRVEAHHLRKRLHQYYASEGAAHNVQIEIRQGQYAPQFIRREPVFTDAVEQHESQKLRLELSPMVEVTPGISVPQTNSRGWKPNGRIILTAISGSLAALILVLVILAENRRIAARSPVDEVWNEAAARSPVPMEYRMLAGYHGPAFTDANGETWNSDAYYTGGASSAIVAGRFIEGEPEPGFLRSQRSGNFHYDIPLRRAVYELHLYFAETEYGGGNPRGGGESTRLFQVSVNGSVRIDSIDVLAEAGAPNRLHVRVLKDVSPAADGKLHLGFKAQNAAALLNALEILPSVPGRMRPIRIVTQPKPVIDPDGHIWSSDRYFLGGNPVLRRESISNVLGKALFQGERYGNFAYHIPLAPGKYRLTLHFAETWFGTPDSHHPVEGQRLFNVFANGTALLESFEVAKEAGGIYRGIHKEFDGLQPNPQGILALEFVPIKNYAEVNAIEVVETD